MVKKLLFSVFFLLGVFFFFIDCQRSLHLYTSNFGGGLLETCNMKYEFTIALLDKLESCSRRTNSPPPVSFSVFPVLCGHKFSKVSFDKKCQDIAHLQIAFY